MRQMWPGVNVEALVGVSSGCGAPSEVGSDSGLRPAPQAAIARETRIRKDQLLPSAAQS